MGLLSNLEGNVFHFRIFKRLDSNKYPERYGANLKEPGFKHQFAVIRRDMCIQTTPPGA